MVLIFGNDDRSSLDFPFIRALIIQFNGRGSTLPKEIFTICHEKVNEPNFDDTDHQKMMRYIIEINMASQQKSIY